MFLELAAIMLLMPYLIKIYEDEFDEGEWENWMRVGPICLTAPGLVAAISSIAMGSTCGLKLTILLYAINLFAVSFVFIFAIATSSFAICAEYEDW
jgi:hypothetical protein